ncbi:hypothetical protein N431DRAFT_510944 [Stipitochalara longipes BDJ]|nr:hypothetical protein N431DRAFT_510944 [Stipitochalara longipes BDJ]
MSAYHELDLESLRMLLGLPRQSSRTFFGLPVYSSLQNTPSKDQLEDPVFISIGFEEINSIKRGFKRTGCLVTLRNSEFQSSIRKTSHAPLSQMLSLLEDLFDRDRNIVVVGHGLGSDLSVLRSLEFDVKHLLQELWSSSSPWREKPWKHLADHQMSICTSAYWRQRCKLHSACPLAVSGRELPPRISRQFHTHQTRHSLGDRSRSLATVQEMSAWCHESSQNPTSHEIETEEEEEACVPKSRGTRSTLCTKSPEDIGSG